MKINVIDGLVGTEVDETSGNPVEMNLVIAGSDMVAVDAVATSVIGIDPSEIRYLQLAEEKGLGIANMKNIILLGEDIKVMRKRFKLPSRFRRRW